MKNPKTLRVLSVNVHVGLGLRAGVIGWLFSLLPFIHIVLIQEASRPPARAWLRRLFPAKQWLRSGPGSQDNDPLVGTFVFARRRRFVLLETANQRVSKARPPVRGKMPFPQRNLNSLVLIDKKTGRSTVVSSVHTWHLVGRELGDGTKVSQEHEKQVIRTAEFHAAKWIPGQVSLAGGDWNEALEHSDGPNSAREHMGSIAGMTPAGGRQAHLDEVFVARQSYLRVKEWRYIKTPFKAMDHPVLYTVLEIDPL